MNDGTRLFKISYEGVGSRIEVSFILKEAGVCRFESPIRVTAYVVISPRLDES